jgi:hypothetical protein
MSDDHKPPPLDVPIILFNENIMFAIGKRNARRGRSTHGPLRRRRQARCRLNA